MSRTQTTYARPSSIYNRSKSSWRQHAIAWVLVLLPIILFGLIWQHYAVNVPKWDDHALRAFLYYSDQETTLLGKLYQLFKQHNEHRIVYDRLITALDYGLFGKLNYKHLMVVGNLSLVGLLVVFIAILRQAGRSLYYAVPIALFLFNLSQWENMYWGMAALQNFSVVLWVVGAFYLLSYTSRTALAIVLALLATLTSGNGLMVWPLGFLLLLLQPVTAKQGVFNRLSAPLVVWTISAIIVVGLYFFHFEKPGGINYVRPSALALVKGWFAVIGAAAEALPFGQPLRNSVLLGGLLTCITLVSIGWELLSHQLVISRLLRQWFARNSSLSPNRTSLPSITLFFWSTAAFILGTAAIVAFARTGFGADLLITSRYKMYSLTLLALLYSYGLVVSGLQFQAWLGGVGYVAGLLMGWLSYYSFLNETIWWRDWLLTNQFNWTYTTNRPVAQLDPVTQQYTQPEPAFYDQTASALFKFKEQQLVPLTVTAQPTNFEISNDQSPARPFDNGGNYLMARSDKRIYLFPVWQNQVSPIQARFIPSSSFTAGFKADIPKADLKADTYKLYVLSVEGDGQQRVYPTNQTITSQGQPADTTKKNW